MKKKVSEKQQVIEAATKHEPNNQDFIKFVSLIPA